MVAGDPQEDAQRAVDAMYAEDLASRSLGIVIENVAPGQATARMRVTAAMVNGHAIAHGGYIFLIADTAFAFACNTRGPHVAGWADIVFVQPAREGDELEAQASERVLSGGSGVYDVTVRRRDGEVVAEFRGQSRRMRAQPE
jgi:acyl-CoA thioesterase